MSTQENPRTDGEDTRLDDALLHADDRLVASLREDEHRRRRIRWMAGGFAVSLIAILAVIVVLATGPGHSGPGGELIDTEKSASLIQEGWALYNQQHYIQAESRFAEAVQLSVDSADAWNGLGWSRYRGGYVSAASEAFGKATRLVEKHPGANNGLGYVSFSRREYELAEQHWTKVASVASASWRGLSHLYLLQGRYEDALTWARKVAAQQPQDELAQRVLAAAKAKRLDPDVRSLIEPEEPGNFSEKSQRGWALFNKGMSREAMELFQQAVAGNPHELSAHNGLGFCLLNMGEHELAEKHFQVCLDLEPDSAGPLNGLARCLQAEGRIDDAIDVWKTMVDLIPQPNAGTHGLAYAYLEKGEYAEALPYFERLASESPDDETIQNTLEELSDTLATKP